MAVIAPGAEVYEAGLGDRARALRKSAGVLDRVVVDVGKALVPRRSDGGFNGADTGGNLATG
jgi:hypothetical protein